MIGIADPKLQALSDGLWAAVQQCHASPVGKAATTSAAPGITLEDLTIAKVRSFACSVICKRW